MMADAYLPHMVHGVPAEHVFDSEGALFSRVRHYVGLGVVRIIAGPEQCHVWIDVRRPYWRPRPTKLIEMAE